MGNVLILQGPKPWFVKYLVDLSCRPVADVYIVLAEKSLGNLMVLVQLMLITM